MSKYTTIRLSKEIALKLTKFKEDISETYEDIIQRLMKEDEIQKILLRIDNLLVVIGDGEYEFMSPEGRHEFDKLEKVVKEYREKYGGKS